MNNPTLKSIQAKSQKQQIKNFLTSEKIRPLVSIKAIEEASEMPRGTLQTYLVDEDRVFANHHLPKLIATLDLLTFPPKVYQSSEFPVAEKNDPKVSVDVICCSAEGYLAICHYNFTVFSWYTNEGRIIVDYFVWMYKPKYLNV